MNDEIDTVNRERMAYECTTFKVLQEQLKIHQMANRLAGSNRGGFVGKAM